MDERQRHDRDVRRERENEQQHADEPDVHFRHFPHVGAGDRASHGEHARDRRCLLTDPEVDGDDDPELHGVDADCPDERHDDRNDQDDRRG